jgi:hypothetical protein
MDWGKVMVMLGCLDLTFFFGIIPALVLVGGFKKITSLFAKNGESEHLSISSNGVSFQIRKSHAINLGAWIVALLVIAAVALVWYNQAKGYFPNRIG